MHKFIKPIGYFLLCLFILSGCHQPAKVYSQTSYVFGTQVDISIYGLSKAQAKFHIDTLFADFDLMHKRLHAWQNSDLTQLNQAFSKHQPAFIDKDIKNWLLNAKQYEKRSGHLFNPATGHLIALWGFHSDFFKPIHPSPARIKHWLTTKPSLTDLRLGADFVTSINPATSLDMGGIAKGWALDRAAAYLRKNQVSHALINLGGNILVLGHKGQQPWTVGIQNPRAPEAIAKIKLHDGEAIGTSGDYQRYFMLNQKRYNHLIDPRTGYPAQGIQAATVIAPPSLEAGTLSDVATKPLFIGGLTSASHYLKQLGIRDALIITANGNAYLTASMQARIEWIKRPKHIYPLI